MSVLSGKKVLLGISGGIAAYKTPNLVRCLVKRGVDVKESNLFLRAAITAPAKPIHNVKC